jgi:signal transduction histidine kinase
VQQLQSINTIFNRRKRADQMQVAAAVGIKKSTLAAEEVQPSFADRFLKTPERKKTKAVLGQEQDRIEEITAGQAMNLAQQEREPYTPLSERRASVDRQKDAGASSAFRPPGAPAVDAAASDEERQTAVRAVAPLDDDRFQVEVAPLQTVTIDADRVFIFRRIGINGQIYRQGFVLRVGPFLDHLLDVYYTPQPISRYTRLTLNAAGLRVSRNRTAVNPGASTGDRLAGRTFPAPFGFLSAEMHAVSLPTSPARQTLTLAMSLFGVVMVAGLVTIYKSARVVLDLSERRSRFVSAVTHELKTPLTNIRMYIEMLDQGIAATPEREQEYLAILASESARLSGLINNVLELSRLEKQTRQFELQEGDLGDVLADVKSIMAERLAREGFELSIKAGRIPVFDYDRDVLVQVLINLMENSIKFGRKLPQKRIQVAADAFDGWVTLAVSDTGPGIPKRALKHIFDDFYRVDSDLARTTGGTGLGLALVKKFILALGGRVQAENNAGPGCTITVSLPTSRQSIT